MSWLVPRHVQSGRDESSFSEWDHDSDAHHAAHEIEDGTMPPRRYTFTYPDAAQ